MGETMKVLATNKREQHIIVVATIQYIKRHGTDQDKPLLDRALQIAAELVGA